MELMIRLKRRQRKLNHVKFLELRINELYNGIVSDTLNGYSPVNKAKLLKKYNRRLKLIKY